MRPLGDLRSWAHEPHSPHRDTDPRQPRRLQSPVTPSAGHGAAAEEACALGAATTLYSETARCSICPVPTGVLADPETFLGSRLRANHCVGERGHYRWSLALRCNAPSFAPCHTPGLHLKLKVQAEARVRVRIHKGSILYHTHTRLLTQHNPHMHTCIRSLARCRRANSP